MAYQKLQVSRAILVIPSNDTDIPFPGAIYFESTTTGNAANKLIDVLESGTNSTSGTTLTDAAKNFITAGVQVGDTVEDTTSGDLATITAVGVNTLTLDTDIFPVAARPYSLGSFIRLGVKPGDIIYNYDSSEATTVTNVDSGTQLSVTLAGGITTANKYKLYKSGQNNGCILYVGAKGNLSVLTIGGDEVIYVAVPDGTFMPVQMLRVNSTSTTATDIIAQW